jgi:O-antigen/teichoic acid export membrane protein
LVSIPLILKYLGTEEYAIFTIITSLTTWFALLEFGLGPALQNYISEANTIEKHEKLEDIFSLVLVLVLVIMLFSILAFFLGANFLQIFLLQSINPTHSYPNYMVGFLALIYAITGASLVIHRFMYAHERGYISNIMQALANLLSLLGVYLVSKITSLDQKLFFILLVWSLPVVLINLGIFFIVFLPYVKKIKIVDFSLLYNLFKRSLGFAAFSAMATGVLSVDYFVMSQTLKSNEIVNYNLVSKIYIFALFFHNALLMANWTSINRAFSEKNTQTIKEKVNQCIIWGISINIMITGILIWQKNLLINILSTKNNSDVQITLTTIILFFIYFCFRVWSDTYAMLFQSRNALKIFWVSVPFQAVISILAQTSLSKIYGIDGVILGLILSFALTVAWTLPVNHYKFIKSLKNERFQNNV